MLASIYIEESNNLEMATLNLSPFRANVSPIEENERLC